MNKSPSSPTPVLLSVSDTAKMLGISTRLVWKLTAAGKFPQPIRPTPKLPRWRKADIDAYVGDLADHR